MTFSFDPVAHIYTIDDQPIPSITQVLPYNYVGDNTEAMDKGTAVHRMAYLYNMEASEDDIYCDPVIIPYLGDDSVMNRFEAYKRFRAVYKLNGIYDIKTGSPVPATELQLAAQVLLVREGISDATNKGNCYETPFYHPTYKFAGTPDIVNVIDGKPFGVYALYLSADGNFKLDDHSKNLRRNIQIFLSFLTVFNYKKERGL